MRLEKITAKTKVFIVLEYGRNNSCKVDKLYTNKADALMRVKRLTRDNDFSKSYHIIKKSIVGLFLEQKLYNLLSRLDK